MDVAIVGAGIFGLATAIELRHRNHNVTVFDQGQVPNELASSTDVAKAIRRTNYLPNDPYIEMVERASRRWREWDEYSGESIYYQVGALTEYRASEFEPGSAGYESITYLKGKRKEIELLSIDQVRDKFPQFVFSEDAGQHFVYDSWAGYLDSGQAVTDLKRLAVENGVEIKEHCRVLDVQEGSGSVEIRTDGAQISFDRSVISAGPWIGRLAPEITGMLLITRQQMAFLRPRDESLFKHGTMPVWSIHPVEEGWYGFPLLRDGTVKITMDLLGDLVDPDVPRKATAEFIDSVKEFVGNRIPLLAHGEFMGARSCLYTNTLDGHFVIDWKPGSDRILLAGGGGGHGFKFGGSIGEVIADSLEDKPSWSGDFFRIGDRFNQSYSASPT